MAGLPDHVIRRGAMTSCCDTETAMNHELQQQTALLKEIIALLREIKEGHAGG
jgi:hypothetical protein